MNHFPVLLRELACAVRQPGPCVRALCESRCSVAVQCDPQQEIQHTHRTTHTGTTTRCRTQRRNTFATETTPAATPPHTRGTFHRRLQPLYLETCKVSRSGFLPKTTQHSCSHYNAFCSIAWLTRISLRTWQNQTTTIIQPLHGCIVM